MLGEYAERWALITGASSGIGAEFARRLAALGMHLVMVARREPLMQQLAEELHTRHGTRCEIVVTDLSQPGEPRRVFDDVAARGITLDLLINNAGFGIAGEVDNADVEKILQLIRLNIAALTELTYLALPGMLERRRGAIVNVASVAAFQPVAYLGAYAASKAYVLHLSEALWAEVRDRGVTVMALCPGTTRTDFFEIAGAAGWLKKRRSQSPEQVVKAALKGLEKRRQYYVPGWLNYVLTILVRLATRRMAVTESMKYFRPSPKKKRRKEQALPPEDKSPPSEAPREQPRESRRTA